MPTISRYVSYPILHRFSCTGAVHTFGYVRFEAVFTSVGTARVNSAGAGFLSINPLMPVGNYSYQFFICCPRDAVSRTANVERTARH